MAAGQRDGEHEVKSVPVLKVLETALDRSRPDWRDRRLLVAFSGGPDSTALLLALHELLGHSGRGHLKAAHVNHGLQNEAGAWAAHCAEVAGSLDVPLETCEVEVRTDGRGMEAAARRERYAALGKLMEPGECLLTAHHQDDQWETLLLRMLRGAGVSGLAGIRESRRCGAGWLLRPLLGVSRGDLRAWLEEKGATFVEDPSNRDTGLDRSFLRERVLPVLLERWPGAGATAGRMARLAAETRELLLALAELDGRDIVAEDSIECAGLRALSPPRRANLVRARLAALGIAAPPEARLNAALDMLLNAAADRHPEARWRGARLTRRRGRIYLSAVSSPETG